MFEAQVPGESQMRIDCLIGWHHVTAHGRFELAYDFQEAFLIPFTT